MVLSKRREVADAGDHKGDEVIRRDTQPGRDANATFYDHPTFIDARQDGSNHT